MKALVLSAGLGTRIRPLTLSIPKVLLPLAGSPLLEYHLTALRQAGITDILINTHYLPKQIEQFVGSYGKQFPDTHISLTYEPELLGSAGTLRKNQIFFGNDDVLVVYGDNLTNLNYLRFFEHHRLHKGLGTIAVYHELQPETKGIVEFNRDLLVQKFIEKPKAEQITTHYANAGIYLFSVEIFKHLPETHSLPFDFGHHVFPFLLKQRQPLFAYVMEEFLLDIGSLESYNKAQTVVKKLFSKG